MTVVGAIGFALCAFLGWRIDAYKRRLRRSRARLVAMRREHDERAAGAALRPRTGNVAASGIHPPNVNGKA